MQTLEHGDTTFDYSGVIANLEHSLNMKLAGVDVKINEHYDEHAVELVIGEEAMMMTLSRARDLVKELQKAITKVSRSYRKTRKGK